MDSLLVTGGAGFIGANFVGYWLNKYPDDRVVVIDALTYAGNRDNLAAVESHKGFRFVHGDICDEALVRDLLGQEKLGTIVHFAAESHVDRSISEPDAFIRTNVVGTHNLLKVAREKWLDSEDAPSSHRFHHVSTDEVFGTLNADDAAFTEETPYAPNSPYAASKAASDHLVRAYHHTYGLHVTTSNCSNNFGPFQFPEKLIPLMIVNALVGKPLPVYGDGTNIRDWLYVEDHCLGIDLVLKKGRVGEAYNIGSNNEQSNNDIVEEVCRRIDQIFAENPKLSSMYPNAPAAAGKQTRCLITYVTDRPGHDWRYAIDARKISDELGYVSSESFPSAMSKTVNWMLENQTWWQPIV